MNKTNRGSGRFHLWLALVLLLAGLIALAIVLNRDPLFVVNNRPTVRAGLLTGTLLSLALLFTGVGWIFLVAVPIGGLAVSRGVALMPSGPAERKPGAMGGVRVAVEIAGLPLRQYIVHTM